MWGNPYLEQALRSTRFRAAISFIAVAWCSLVAAQTVRGTVVDSSSSQPIANATIEVRLPNDQVAARESADKAGQFRIRLRAEGAYRVRVQRIGYRMFESAALVLTSKTDTTLEVRLAAVPVELESVSVTAAETNSYLKTSGFYLRKEGGAGRFLDPETVGQLVPKARLATDLIVHIPGVRITRVRGIPVPQLRNCRTLNNPESGLLVYVDGNLVGSEAFALLMPGDVLAIEVYMGVAEVPLQYGGTNAPCGVILVWTKR